MKKTKYLGIIPARGGSKGVPRKNIRMIAGKPLIAWTIEAAKKSKLLDRFVVSTEDKEIAEFARSCDAEVIDRPPELATDTASGISVIQHALAVINAKVVVILQPNAPIKDEGLIDECIKRFEEKGAESLATGFICMYEEYGTYFENRQKRKGFFYDDGNVLILTAKLVRQGKLIGEKAERMVISREQNVEIDDPFDFWLAEQVLLKRIKERE
ncbi:MAG: N-acylneuraminate cytidylyltransferase [Candidatus Saganbacteria bacterium]|uniref:N-acylneuraminate cytidylyltransferase n=1 Tax=Candidatus Saganbacteria bacterium TaxID=2575572 RepID=A0A833L2E8_UNCSA|nr:MAG: N-acylneuraminate cytidylyltransferase [Candidatus Saganbacteria bacterium]